ncbi:6-phospho-3-hexuloisomerase [Chelativorans salis]|uniref:SIS domain-containing protein n=1 Tax=Chelativorans salis TaxID=2978478 RepID=A0ABT2LTG0_9HYPH|nr:6-phospho-3-hexuloisomerase [Chelativorans sp. EGI FJ00035]MCT7377828.1 SIS domain-containing protein [Chelativorans sp. EGI FJ00035]
MIDIAEAGTKATSEIARSLAQIDEDAAARAVAMCADARRIALYGVGREGLMMKGLAMRLFHLGLDAHVVGDMTTPRLGEGDLLIVSAGPGYFSTVSALVATARAAGAKTLCITAQADGESARLCDAVLVLPAQTMADDTGREAAISILPMGSLFEGVQYLAFELLIMALRERLGESAETMRARHTNLE